MILIICDFGPSGKAEFDGESWSGNNEVFVDILNLDTVTARGYFPDPVMGKVLLMCKMYGGEVIEKHGVLEENDKRNIDPRTVW